MSYPANTISIGILGGGQLARMLCIRGMELGFKVSILSQSKDDPAAQVCGHWNQGDPTVEKDIKEFSKNKDIITFESEFIDIATLKKVHTGKFFPQVDNMRLFQNRDSQKKWLTQNKIPTASPYKLLSLETFEASQIEKDHPQGFVLKECFGGYDGYGTYISRPKNKLSSLEITSILSKSKSGILCEPFIPFKNELAISFFRSPDGTILVYPLVETFQKNHKCFWVKGPVKHKALSPLVTKIKRALNSIKYVGAITFELFDFNNQLIVNEVAPRVHNSAHYSQDAFYLDQFSLHLLALTNQLPKKLSSPLSKGFAMLNIIGTQHKKDISLPSTANAKLYWYGKHESRPGRKLGHLNSLDSTPNKALDTLLKIERTVKL